jgi:hypothetical protein
MLRVQREKGANVLLQVVASWVKSLGSLPVNLNGVPENVTVVFKLFLT